MDYRAVQLYDGKIKTENIYCRMIQLKQGIIPGNQGYAVGIDPGVNFGITVIKNEIISVYHGTLRRENKPGCYGFDAFYFLRSLDVMNYKGNLTIEGAAYNKVFGQVGLEEVRQGFFLSAITNEDSKLKRVQIIPPATVRKAVFNDGKMQASDVYVTLNHNAADSLAIALYSLMEN